MTIPAIVPPRLSLVLAGCLLAGSCASPQAPVVRPFADGVHWLLVDDMIWTIGDSAITIVVPRGFVMDFASVPQELQSFVSPVDRHGRAAIVHDYLYWEQRCTREQADELMRAAMDESEVEPVPSSGIYWAVRWGGAAAWEQNAAERAQGLPRMVPEDALAAAAEEDWPAYRGALFERGVRPEPRADGPAEYCDAAGLVPRRNDSSSLMAILEAEWMDFVWIGIGLATIVMVVAGPIVHFVWLWQIRRTVREIGRSVRSNDVARSGG